MRTTFHIPCRSGVILTFVQLFLQFVASTATCNLAFWSMKCEWMKWKWNNEILLILNWKFCQSSELEKKQKKLRRRSCFEPYRINCHQFVLSSTPFFPLLQLLLKVFVQFFRGILAHLSRGNHRQFPLNCEAVVVAAPVVVVINMTDCTTKQLCVCVVCVCGCVVLCVSWKYFELIWGKHAMSALPRWECDGCCCCCCCRLCP